MSGEKFHLIFSEEPNTKCFIDEPIGYSDVEFVTEQKENRMGRDESLDGSGEFRFRFVDYRNHYLDKILYYYHYRGFEADIKLVNTTENGLQYISEFHFVDVDTDELTYLECRMITLNSQQVIKTRRETKVDMFSNVDIDGNYIEPLQPVNMLLQAKPSFQTSLWEQVTPTTADGVLGPGSFFNITQALMQSEIENSFVPYMAVSQNRADMQILEAQSNLKNVVIYLTDLDIDFGAFGLQSTTVAIRYIKTGENVDNATPNHNQIYEQSVSGGSGKLVGNFTVSIGDMQRGEKLYLYLFADSNTIPTVTVNKAFTKITASSTAYNSIVPAFRLIDVMRQIVKSISGADVLSKRYDFGGQFYDNVLFNGNLMRSVTDKPFSVSLDDIEKSIWAEHKGDSELTEEGALFFGIEKDFYTDIECGFFDDTQFEEMHKNTNQKYAINEFKFKYGKYQSLKENTEPNSDSTIHGESIWTLFNKRGPNKIEANVDWVRDSILIDAQQRLATKISKDTATQEDDTIFCVDVIDTTEDRQFTETTNLQHTSSVDRLTLRSNGEVNFITLGIKPFTTFIIELPNVNAGTYNVESVTTTEIVLSGGSTVSTNNGVKLTRYTYEIKKETIPVTNRTDEGFTAISNLISPELYSNMRYSKKRNILNYWNNTLATANLFWEEKPIRSTYYKNNGKCNTTYAGLTVIENDPFIPTDPILSTNVYESLTFVNVDFEDYIILRNKIKKDRGYIRAINKNMRVIKVYPTKITYVNSERRLVINGEEKFEKAYLTISNEGGIILINNETRLMHLDYSIENNEVSLFDRERFRLYNPVFWDKTTINNAVPESLNELIGWLELLK